MCICICICVMDRLRAPLQAMYLEFHTLETFIKAIRKDPTFYNNYYSKICQIKPQNIADISYYYLFKKLNNLDGLREHIKRLIYKEGEIKVKINPEYIIDYILAKSNSLDIIFYIVMKKKNIVHDFTLCFSKNLDLNDFRNYIYVLIKIVPYTTDIHKSIIKKLKYYGLNEEFVFLWNYSFINRKECFDIDIGHDLDKIIYVIKQDRFPYNYKFPKIFYNNKKILKLLIDTPITSDYIDTEIYTECQICFIERNEDVKYEILEPCGHSGYCQECIKKMNKKCPRCRCSIDDKDIGKSVRNDEEEEE